MHLSLATTIRQYINAKYDQHPDMFRPDLEAIDTLRTDAINVREPHSSGIKKLQAYAAQLVWIGGKFPIDVRSTLKPPHRCEMLTNIRLVPSLPGILHWDTTPNDRWCAITSNTSL